MKDFVFNCLNTFNDSRHPICFQFWHRFVFFLLQEAFKNELDTSYTVYCDCIKATRKKYQQIEICCPRLKMEKQIKIYFCCMQTQVYVKNQYFVHKCVSYVCPTERLLSFLFI